MTVNAQTQSTPKKDKTEQCDRSRKCDGKDKKGKKDGARKHHNKGERPDLFDGITLTPQQKTQLDALKAECKAQPSADKPKMSKEDRHARRAEFSAKVKDILTPEQYAVYQKNVDNMKANHKKKNS